MRKKAEISETEKKEFREAMHGIKPLSHHKIIPSTPIVAGKKKMNEVSPPPTFEFSDYEKFEPVSGEDLIEFMRPGIQYKVLRKLRTGQYNVNAILDLHGKNAMEAKQALSDFLMACQQNDIRHVLVIHGKGRVPDKPVLKNKLNHWLRQTEQVLAFCSASKHGRGGALYVLLKGK